MEKNQDYVAQADNLRTAKAKTILLIDDCRDQLELNESILEPEGYKIFTASSGDEALLVLSEIDPPDLILLDIQMGDTSGPEFLKRLEKMRPEIFENVPIVFFTAHDEAPVSKAVGLIRKPVDIERFLKAVQRFIEKGTDRSLRKH